MSENSAIYNLLNLKVTLSKVLFCPNNAPKPKDNQFIITKAAYHIAEARTRGCLVFLLEKLLTRLIDHQNKCSSELTSSNNWLGLNERN